MSLGHRHGPNFLRMMTEHNHDRVEDSTQCSVVVIVADVEQNRGYDTASVGRVLAALSNIDSRRQVGGICHASNESESTSMYHLDGIDF
jgi:hypothetical protein